MPCRKSDHVDAEKLVRYARLDPNILRPISHRTVEWQEALTLIRARELLVRLPTAHSHAAGSTAGAWSGAPADLEMTIKIKHYGRLIQQLTQAAYPTVARQSRSKSG